MKAEHTARTVSDNGAELTFKCGTCKSPLYYFSLYGFNIFYCTICKEGRGFSRGNN